MSETKETVLIVEDDETIAIMEQRHLERAGYAVVAMGRVDQARERLQEGGIDLVVLDYRLPGGDTGLDFYGEMKEAGRDLPVIMVTGYADEATVIAALRAGVRDFITKSKQYLSYLPEAVARVLAQEKTKHALAQSQENLRHSVSLMRATLEATADGLLVVDAQNKITDFNSRFVTMWQIPPEILESSEDASTISFIQEQLTSPGGFFEKIPTAYAHTSHSTDVLDLADGRVIERSVHWQLLDDSPVGRVLSFRDITEQKKAEDRLNHMANHDALTGLPNRTLFNDRISQAIARLPWHNRLAALLFLDIDRFKLINDTMGHVTADLMLKAIGDRLKECVRDGDTVARLGGDEFTVLLVDVAAVDDISRMAQKILEAIEKPFELNGQPIYVTTSIGISLCPADGVDAATLLKNADSAMYAAKDKKGNNFQFYSEIMGAQTASRLVMESALHLALEREEFVLHYQPLIDVSTGKFAGVEALLRWQQNGFLVSPAQFIPLAEETGLIVPIGEWVLRTACAQNKAWQNQNFPPMRVAVNLSGRQLQLPHLGETINSILHETGLEPRYLELELTESMMQSPQATETLRAMKKLGTHLAIDDFGTGYSSLSLMQRYPLHKLKVDQSFTRDLATDPNTAALVTAIIAMAQSLGLKVTVEGVETMEQLTFLRTLRCDELQGYLFSRPLPAHEVTNLLKSQHEFTGFPSTAHCGEPLC